MKNQQIFLLIAAVVLAGCVGQPSSVTSTNGIIIKSFTVNPPAAESGIPVFIEVVVKNVGEYEAKNVLVRLLGLTDEWTTDVEGKMKIDDTWRKEGTNKIFTGDAKDMLFPADPSRGFQGEETLKEWKLFPPEKNVELDYEVTARAEYDYQSVSESLLRAVSVSYFRQTNKAGGLVSSKTSGGPLVVNILTSSTTIAEGNNKLRVQIQVQNVGGGRTSLDGNLDRVNVETYSRLAGDPVHHKQFIIIDCSSSDEIYDKAGMKQASLKLVGGKTGTISCEIPLKSVSPYVDMPITVKVYYRYMADSSTQIKVLAQR